MPKLIYRICIRFKRSENSNDSSCDLRNTPTLMQMIYSHSYTDRYLFKCFTWFTRRAKKHRPGNYAGKNHLKRKTKSCWDLLTACSRIIIVLIGKWESIKSFCAPRVKLLNFFKKRKINHTLHTSHINYKTQKSLKCVIKAVTTLPIWLDLLCSKSVLSFLSSINLDLMCG